MKKGSKPESQEEVLTRLIKYQNENELMRAANLLEAFYPELSEGHQENAKTILMAMIDYRVQNARYFGAVVLVQKELKKIMRLERIMIGMGTRIIIAEELTRIKAIILSAEAAIAHSHLPNLTRNLENTLPKGSTPEQIKLTLYKVLMTSGFPIELNLIKEGEK